MNGFYFRQDSVQIAFGFEARYINHEHLRTYLNQNVNE